MNAIAIINLISGITAALPSTLDIALKLKGLIEGSGLGTVDVKALGDSAIAADDATMADINAWLVAKGFPALPVV